jgi:hypothetical protein
MDRLGCRPTGKGAKPAWIKSSRFGQYCQDRYFFDGLRKVKPATDNNFNFVVFAAFLFQICKKWPGSQGGIRCA